MSASACVGCDRRRAELTAGRELVEEKFEARTDCASPVQGFGLDWDFARVLFRENPAILGSPGRSAAAVLKTVVSKTSP